MLPRRENSGMRARTLLSRMISSPAASNFSKLDTSANLSLPIILTGPAFTKFPKLVPIISTSSGLFTIFKLSIVFKSLKPKEVRTALSVMDRVDGGTCHFFKARQGREQRIIILDPNVCINNRCQFRKKRGRLSAWGYPE